MALGKNLTKPQEKTDLENPSVEAKSQNEPVSVVQVADSKDESDEENNEFQTLQQFCVFQSGDEEYAIPIHLVKEVVPYPVAAHVPQMPDYIRGMANVRGNIFGILDIAVFFKIEQKSEHKYLLVLDTEEYQMGIAIPDVPDSLLAAEDSIESFTTSRLKSTVGQKYLKGIIKKDRRMIILFDILGMISGDKFTKRG